MPAKMTSTAWDQGFKNMLICGVGVLLYWLAIVAVVALVFRKSFGDSAGPACAVLWVSILLAFLANWLHGRATAGPVLLDCGPHPTRWLFLLQAVLFLFMGLAGWYSGRSSAAGFAVSGPVCLVSFAAYWTVMATGRLQLRENGIWGYWGLLQWRKIDSCQWTEDSTLFVKSKGGLALLQGALPVPPEHRQAVSDLLARHCSIPPAAAAAADGPHE